MDALQRFDAIDEQQARAEIEQEAAWLANDIANAIGAVLQLDIPEWNEAMNATYRVLIAKATAPPSMEQIPY